MHIQVTNDLPCSYIKNKVDSRRITVYSIMLWMLWNVWLLEHFPRKHGRKLKLHMYPYCDLQYFYVECKIKPPLSQLLLTSVEAQSQSAPTVWPQQKAAACLAHWSFQCVPTKANGRPFSFSQAVAHTIVVQWSFMSQCLAETDKWSWAFGMLDDLMKSALERDLQGDYFKPSDFILF